MMAVLEIVQHSMAYRDAREHLADELAWLDLLLARHVARIRATGRFCEDPFRGLFISDAEADAALARPTWPQTPFDQRVAAKRAAVDAAAAASAANGITLPLQSLVQRFHLDELATQSLLIAAAPSLDRRYETLFSYAQNDVGRKRPAVDLVLDLLALEPANRFDMLARFRPGAPLVRDRLIVFAEGEDDAPLPSRSLRVDDRVAEALLDVSPQADARIAIFVSRGDGRDDAIMDPAAIASLDALMPSIEQRPMAIILNAPADCGQRQLAEAVCRKRGLALIEASLQGSTVADMVPSDRLGVLLAREAIMSGAGLLLVADERLATGRLETVTGAACRAGLPLFVATAGRGFERQLVPGAIEIEAFEMPPATYQMRASWWRSLLGAHALNGATAAGSARLAIALRLGPDGIAETVRSARRSVAPCGSGPLTTEVLLGAARQRARCALPRLARRIESHWSWDDLVLPARQIEQLREISTSFALWNHVHDKWGFAAKAPQGRAMAVLFSGPSGTGKTMAGSVIARAVGLDLFRIDLASVVSKYIGETEQNIDRLFNEAMRANAVLFFDEADALFGKRTEVKDAHDRYANLEVSYLLQRIEDHEGLVILATNLNGSLDEAFARRLRHIVVFPLPDKALRAQLWRQAFPTEAPLDRDLDLELMARLFELSGGNIRNAALAAAFFAAADDRPIGARHLVRAIARELEKLGRPPNAADFGELRGFVDGDARLAP
jgi:hypothetical protein